MKHHVSFDLDFKRNPYKGTYIALEGIDGSGKSYQLEALEKALKKKGNDVIVTREPRKESGAFYETIMDILLGKVKVPALSLQYLFTADRIANQKEVVIPALEEGKVVISDRSFWSIIPYAFSDLKIEPSEEVANFMLMNQWVLAPVGQTFVPDTTMFLDISVDVAVERLAGKDAEKEIYEKRSKITKHHNVYKWLVDSYGMEFTIVDGEKTEKEVTKNILAKIEKLR